MLLLVCSNNLLASNQDMNSSTGEKSKIDTMVTIPLDLVRKANAKMIERKYLLYIVNQQDSIIILKDVYIEEQNKIINDFQNRITQINAINESINNDLNKQKINTRIAIGGGLCVAIGLIIGIICK